jgi:ElaB/YqjD/DUF883 family membrane-anchored ribosome-binding protein
LIGRKPEYNGFGTICKAGTLTDRIVEAGRFWNLKISKKIPARLKNVIIFGCRSPALVRVCRRQKDKGERIVMNNEANMEKLGTDLKELTRDAEAMLEATAAQTGEKMNQLRGRLSTALDSARATYHRVEEKTVAGAKVADKTIREHPYESIGIAAGAAFGLGLLIGVLAGRR